MLTAKEEKFSVNVFSGMTLTDAYKDAYDAENMKDETIYVKASNLIKKDKIRIRVQELREKANNEAIMSAIDRKKWLTKVIKGDIKENEIKEADISTKIKAIDTLNKMDGEYIEKLKLSSDDDKPFEVNIKVVE